MTVVTREAREPVRRAARGERVRGLSDQELLARVGAILHRRPAVGFALGVVRAGQPAFFRGHGLANIGTGIPVDEDTVFRIASVTKLFSSIAAMQLWEEGRVDLDAPAASFLRAYPLVAAQPGWHPPTLRHLLTHTAGIPEIRGMADLLRADFTPSGGRPATLSVRAGQPMPSLAEYYRDGLRFVVEPGTTFAYTNHGFATVGQIVQDVSGMSLERWFRERIFEPLGMADTDLTRSERIASRLATGYVLGRNGPRPVADREWISAGSSGIYSTPRDMARFATALLGGGANEHGRILAPATLALMLEPHFQPDPRLPGVGLGFFRAEAGDRRLVGHDGILPGLNSALLVAPDDGVAIVAFTNGSSGAFGWLQIELDQLMRLLLRVPDEAGRGEPAQHPEVWADLCGRYDFAPRISDLRGRLMMPDGVEVFVGGGRLKVRPAIPASRLMRGLALEPDDEQDPDAFRLDLSRFGIPSMRVVFSRDGEGRVTAVHTDLGGQPWSLDRRPEPGWGGRWRTPTLAAVAATGLTVAIRRMRRQKRRAVP